MSKHPVTSNTEAQPNKVFIAAGEVSGDLQAARLARAIRAQAKNVILFGAGGEEMRVAGIDVRVFTPHLGCVGLLQSVRFAPKLNRLFNELLFLSVMGGAVGVILGSAVSYFASSIAGFETPISLFGVILGFSFSAIVGICFGFQPASKASKSNPMEALRYEWGSFDRKGHRAAASGRT